MSCQSHLPPVDINCVSAVSILSAEHEVILQTLLCLEKISHRALLEEQIPEAHALDNFSQDLGV